MPYNPFCLLKVLLIYGSNYHWPFHSVHLSFQGKEEQNLAESGDLEYAFQVKCNIKNGSLEIAMFQQFIDKVTKLDKHTRFLPWNTVEDAEMPEIDLHHSLYNLI